MVKWKVKESVDPLHIYVQYTYFRVIHRMTIWFLTSVKTISFSCTHYPKNLNIDIKIEPHGWSGCKCSVQYISNFFNIQYIWPRNQICTVASAPAINTVHYIPRSSKNFVFAWELNLFLSCFGLSALYSRIYWNSWPCSLSAYSIPQQGYWQGTVRQGSVRFNLTEDESYLALLLIYDIGAGDFHIWRQLHFRHSIRPIYF